MISIRRSTRRGQPQLTEQAERHGMWYLGRCLNCDRISSASSWCLECSNKEEKKAADRKQAKKLQEQQQQAAEREAQKKTEEGT